MRETTERPAEEAKAAARTGVWPRAVVACDWVPYPAIMAPIPPTQPWKQGFSRRLGYYLLGLSIGLIMLGVIWQLRDASMRRDEMERRVMEQQAAQPPEGAPAVQPPGT